MTTHSISSQGIPLHVEDAGQGLAVLFVHGILMDGRMWDALAPDLAKGHRVVVMDQRGHGRSGPAPADFTIADLAGDILAVLDHLGIGQAVLVGHSLGGMAAMSLVASHPDRVSGLVLFNTSPEPEGPNKLRYRILARLALHLGPKPFLVDQVVPLLFGKTYQDLGRAGIATWKERWAALNPPSIHRAVRCLVRRGSLEGDLPKVTVPTLVLTAEEDLATPHDLGKRIKDLVPNARLRELPRCGHTAPVERPEESLDVVTDLLDEVRHGRKDLRTGAALRK